MSCLFTFSGNPMAYIMAVKEDSELSTIKKACQVTVDVFSKYLKEQIMDIIDSDKKVEKVNHHKKFSVKNLLLYPSVKLETLQNLTI